MDMTESECETMSENEELSELMWNRERDLKNLRKQIDAIEDIITYMERDNEEIRTLVEKRKEKQKDIRL
jgi:hypothetical protein